MRKERSLEGVLQLQTGTVGGNAEVVVVTIELGLVLPATGVLIHGRELQPRAGEEIVEAERGRIERTVEVAAVAIEEIIARGELQLGRGEITHLCITAVEVEFVVELHAFGETHVHGVTFGGEIPTMVEHGEFKTEARVVGALVFALDIETAAHTDEHFARIEVLGAALRGGHHAPRLISEATGVEQRGNVPIVGEGFRGGIRAGAGAVENAQLVAQLAFLAHGKQTVRFDTEVEARGHRRGDGVEGIRQNDGSRERSGQHGEERLAESGEIGVGKRRLELTGAETEAVVHLDIEPSLLQHVGTAGGGIDREVVGHFVVGLAGETEHGIGHGEAGVGHIVLIVGLVQPFIVIPIEGTVSLHHEVGLELEAAVVAAHGERSVVVDAHHTVGGGFVLGVEGEQRAGGKGKSNEMFHCDMGLSCCDKKSNCEMGGEKRERIRAIRGT